MGVGAVARVVRVGMPHAMRAVLQLLACACVCAACGFGFSTCSERARFLPRAWAVRRGVSVHEPGYRDDDDGILQTLEATAAAEMRRKSEEEWRAARAAQVGHDPRPGQGHAHPALHSIRSHTHSPPLSPRIPLPKT